MIFRQGGGRRAVFTRGRYVNNFLQNKEIKKIIPTRRFQMIRIDFTAQRIPAAKTSFVKSFRSNSKLVFQTLRNKKIGGKAISLNACTIICGGIVSVHYREEGCIIEPNSRQCQNQCFPNNDETMVDIFSFSRKVKKTKRQYVLGIPSTHVII